MLLYYVEQLTGEPQVSLGHLFFDDPAYKDFIITPSSPESFFSFSTDNSLILFTCNVNQSDMAPLLTHIGAHRFTLPNFMGHGDLMVTLDMIHAFLEHDAHLRAGTVADRATPVGYGDFALSFNMIRPPMHSPLISRKNHQRATHHWAIALIP